MDIAYSREALHALMALGMDDRLRAVNAAEILAADPHIDTARAWLPLASDEAVAETEPSIGVKGAPDTVASTDEPDQPVDTVDTIDDPGDSSQPEAEASTPDEAGDAVDDTAQAAPDNTDHDAGEGDPASSTAETDTTVSVEPPELKVDPDLKLLPLSAGKGLYILPYTATGDLVVSVEENNIIVLALIDVLGGIQQAAQTYD